MGWKAALAALAGLAVGVGVACYLRTWRSCGDCTVGEVNGELVYAGPSAATR